MRSWLRVSSVLAATATLTLGLACGTESDSSPAGGGGAPAGSGGTAGAAATGGTAAGSGSGGSGGVGGSAVGGSAGVAGAGGAEGAGGSAGQPAQGPVGWASVAGLGVATTTGGGTATPVTVTDATAFQSAVSGAADGVVEVSGSITGDSSIGSNKTIYGASGAKLVGSLAFNGSVNVILRDLTIVGWTCADTTECGDGKDAITVRSGAHHIWFHHLDISDGSDGCIGAGYDADLLVENNVFVGVKDPIRLQSPSAGTKIQTAGNLYQTTTGNLAADQNTPAFTPPYPYSLDPASVVAAKVKEGAGPK